MPRPWTDIVAEKRAIRDEKLAKSYGEDALSDPRIMAAKDIQDLVKLLDARQVTAEAILLAHIAKAKEAHQRTNCLTEICFDEALQQARELDAFQQEHGRLMGPLHGVPVSLKDQFDLKGLDSTLGYVGRAFKPAVSDCVLVKVLKQLGAVIIAKTNLPQSILWGETDNPLWGLTTHPMNPEYTPGGSSGGEGTLLALNGSALGWGTDIGGSIRVPSHMNGLWGLKPSSGRFSYEGVAVSQDGQHQIPSVVGPMARTLSTITLASKAVIEAECWRLDPQLPPMPWREDVFQEYLQKPLVFGIMLDDGTVKDDHYTVDGGEDIRRDIDAGGEPYMPHVQNLVDRGSAISVYEYWQLNKRKKALQAAYNNMWNATKSSSGRPIDVLLVPTMPHTAIPHRTLRYPGYTKLFNMLDYTALSIPAGKASKAFDSDYPGEYEPRNAADAWNWGLYDVEKMDGYSVGLQIVAALGTLVDELDTSETSINMSVALYMLSMSIFPICWSAISEQFGRRSTYLVSFAIFIIFSILCAVIGAGTIADIWGSHDRGRAMSLFYLGPMLGPLLGPLLGGVLTQHLGWRSIMWFMAIYGFSIIMAIFFVLPETLARKGEPAMLQELMRISTRDSIKVKSKEFTTALKHYLLEPLSVLLLLRFPPVFLTVLIAALAFSSVYILNIAIESGFTQPPYNFNQTAVGLTYLSTGMGYIVSSIVGGRWMDSIMAREARKAERYDEQENLIYLPEDRMKENAWVANTIYPLSLLWFGWTMHYGLQYMAPISSLFVFGFASMLHFSENSSG
ncbi:amidase [Fusarium coicis]|nr:amidase [Fusarium coicis]